MRFLFVGLLGLLLVSSVFSLDKQRDCKCRIKTSPRIVNGRNATGIPWQISLSIKQSHLPDYMRDRLPDSAKTVYHNCGGSIMNEYFILTAGHCVGSHNETNPPEELEIGFGDNDLVKIYDKKLYKPIAAIYRHPCYYNDNMTVLNDVALLKLGEPLTFSDAVQPACLGFDEQEFYNGTLVISGWGSIKPVSIDIRTMKVEDLPVYPRFLQEGQVYDYSKKKFCRPQNLCVVNERTNASACYGDSGGPIHHMKDGKNRVVGVASFVEGVLENNKVKYCGGPQGYARLSSFQDWVEKWIGQEYCS